MKDALNSFSIEMTESKVVACDVCVRVDEHVAFDVGVEARDVVVALQLVLAEAEAEGGVELEVDLDAFEPDEREKVRAIGIGSGQGDSLRFQLK